MSGIVQGRKTYADDRSRQTAIKLNKTLRRWMFFSSCVCVVLGLIALPFIISAL
jgi:hypothetical protein